MSGTQKKSYKVSQKLSLFGFSYRSAEGLRNSLEMRCLSERFRSIKVWGVTHTSRFRMDSAWHRCYTPRQSNILGCFKRGPQNVVGPEDSA